MRLLAFVFVKWYVCVSVLKCCRRKMAVPSDCASTLLLAKANNFISLILLLNTRSLTNNEV